MAGNFAANGLARSPRSEWKHSPNRLLRHALGVHMRRKICASLVPNIRNSQRMLH